MQKRRRETEKYPSVEEEKCHQGGKLSPEREGHNPWRSPRKGSPGGGRRSSAGPTGGGGWPNSVLKGEQCGDNRTVPSTLIAGSAEKGKNAKKRKLHWHSKCLQAAGQEVNVPDEG